ncbi:RNA-directed DNA polymerase from mobile element jockey [Trichonephila clavipes]|nr:RNA-directed DNA polymerase from mobile element jockey [Trichonephila clavipes]
MATANDMDLTQNGIINNVHIPSSPSRFVITDQFIYDNQQSVRELINPGNSYAIWARKLPHRPSCRQGKDELTAVLAPHIYRGPGCPLQESGRATHPSNSCGLYSKRDCVPSDTTLNSSSKRTLKNLRLKTDKKRLIDDDGFQTPDKRHITKKKPDEDAGKSNPTAVGTLQNRIPPIFVYPPDNWCTLISIARQLAPTLISKLTANDEGVDEELLARAFRAALRKLSHPDDKACEIFQAYVALKNGQTKLEPDQYPLIANYHLYKDDRVVFPRIRTAGGTAIYCKSNFVQSRAPLPGIQGNNLTIAGDLNAAHKTWNNTRSSNFGFRLKRIIQNYPNARIVAPYTPTHINSRSRPGVRDSIIDLAVFKNIPFNYDIRVIDDLCSDHLPVILTLYTNSDTMKIPAQFSTNWENFRFLLKNKPLSIPASPSNEHLDVAIGRLGENISEALVAALKPKFQTVPFILPPDIRSKIRHRNRVRIFWQRSRDPALKNERTISNEIASDIRHLSRADGRNGHSLEAYLLSQKAFSSHPP